MLLLVLQNRNQNQLVKRGCFCIIKITASRGQGARQPASSGKVAK